MANKANGYWPVSFNGVGINCSDKLLADENIMIGCFAVPGGVFPMVNVCDSLLS